MKQFEIFPESMHTSLKKKKIWLQALQIEAFQQRYLKYLCETPYSEGEVFPKTYTILKISSKTNFMSSLVTKLENLFAFVKNLWKNQLKIWISKKVADQSRFSSNIQSLFYTC